MRLRLVSVIALCLCVFTHAAAADWAYDFSSAPPATFVAAKNDSPSSTFTATARDGVLHVVETNPDSVHFAGSVLETSQTFRDVRVQGLLNADGTSHDSLILDARTSARGVNSYGGGIDFSTGELVFVKVAGGGGPDILVRSTDAGQGRQPALTDVARGYFVQLDVIADRIQVSAFDAPGGTRLLHIDFTDRGVFGGPVLGPGFAGITAVSNSGGLIRGTFDNLSARAIPEPSVGFAGIVMSMALLGRRRDR
jgi:hypothetical protein